MSIEKNSSRVSLVLDPIFSDEGISLRELMPVWIIDSPQNRAAVQEIRASELGESEVTTFQAKEGESLLMACERIVQSLDGHFDEHSQIPAYTELNVIGVSLGDVALEPFLELNFSEFVRTATGFIAKKARDPAAVTAN